jgi:cobalt-zinc-cadmium resistance protein CzcA
MLDRMISVSLNNKVVVLLAVFGLIIWGIISLKEIAIDAVPDITNQQVQIVTSSQTLAAEEVEQYITFPIEGMMANLPRVTGVRSISRYGLSVVTVEFEEDMELLAARQLVAEQISRVREIIPPDLGTPEMMPITTGLGEIFQYVLVVDEAHRSKYTPMDLRTIQDHLVKRQLMGVPGIIETSSFGGFVKQYEVSFKPHQMAAYGVTVADLAQALETNNTNGGGGYIEQGEAAFYLRVEGRATHLEDLANVVVKTEGKIPIMVRDVADVRFGHPQRYGAMTMDGKGEVVGGITLMLKGTNATAAVENVKERVELIRKNLPEGVDIYPYLDRSVLVSKTMKTVAKNLIEGGLIVILVLLLFLGNWRAGLIVASVIPLAMLFTLIAMRLFGVSANLMSLGAIDFGIVVDGAVIIVEGILFHLHHRFLNQKLNQAELEGAVKTAASRVLRSSTFGVLIILIVFVPLFMLQGIEGKMFRPMAQTVSFAIAGALLLSLTYVPVMASLFLSKHVRPEHKLSERFTTGLRRSYQPALQGAMKHPRKVLVGTLIIFALSIFAFTRMGSEFIPTLEEGDLAMQLSVDPGSSLTRSIAATTEAETLLRANFPEIKHVVSKIGTAEVPTDPMAIEDADVMIILEPREVWTSASTREELIAKMKDVLAPITGVSIEFTQPIQLRFNELMTGAKTDVAVKIFGEDNEVLKDLADDAALRIATVEGAADVKVDRTEGLRQLKMIINRDQLAAFGCSIEAVTSTLEAAYGGRQTGVVFENERRFDVVIRMAPSDRTALDLDQLFVSGTNGQQIALSQLAAVKVDEGPMVISREGAKRRIIIGVNTRNRDVASIVADIQEKLSDLPLPPGYFIAYGGQFENLNHAMARLKLAVPMALGLILVVLYMALGSVRDAAIIFMAIPLATIGGIWALILRDMPFSISAGIGFIALFGVAVLNGLVLLNEFNRLRAEVFALNERIMEGALSRLRPVLMTATVASIGFLPMALSSSNGAEVQRPLATVVIGGLITSTLLTLLFIPALYYLAEKRRTRVKPGAVLVLLLLGTGFQTQAQSPISLQQLEVAARANRLELTQARLDQQEAALRVRDVYRLGELGFNLQYGQINYAGNDHNLEVRQDFGNPWASGSKRRAASAAEAGANAQVEVAEKNLVRNLYSLYEQYCAARAIEQLFIKTIDRLAQADTVLRNQAQMGRISALDHQLIQTALRRWRNMAGLASADAERIVNELRYLAGLEAAAAIEVLEVEVRNEPSINTLDPILLKPNEARQEQARYVVEGVGKQRLPSLELGAFNQSLEGIPSFNGVVIGLRVPLIANGVKRDQAYAEIELLRRAAEVHDERLRLEAQRNVLIQELQRYRDLLAAYPPNFVSEVELTIEQVNALILNGEADAGSTFLLYQSLVESWAEYHQLVLRNNLAVLHYQYLTQIN